MERSKLKWFAPLGRIAVSAVAVAGLVASASIDAGASKAKPKTAPVGVDALLFAPPLTPSIAKLTTTDLTASGIFPTLQSPVVVSQIRGDLLVTAISPTGVLLASIDPLTSGAAKPAAPLPGLAALPAVTAVSSAIVLATGGAAMAVQTSTGSVDLLTTPGAITGTWQLTALTGGPPIVTTPELGISPAGVLELFATTASGHVIEWANDGFAGNTWNAYDLSLVTGLPPVVGSPQLANFEGDGAVQTVMVETTSHRLILLLDDNSTFTIWRQVPLQLPQGLVPTAPVQFGVTSTGLIASYTVSGGLVVGTSAGARSPWTWTDLSDSLTRAKFATAAGSVPALVSTAFPTIVVRATTGDLISVGSFTSSSTAIVTNLSAAVGTGERVSSDVTVTMTPTGPAFGGLDGGPIALVNKIVLLAKSLDQTGAGIVETPLNTNCNPYTAYFGRGSTGNCPKGTAAEEWCSDFANWVWAKSGASVVGITGYSFTFVNHGQRLGTFKAGAANNPKPGDAVVWGYLASGVGNHVGLVVGVKGNLIDVVAGNAGPVTKQGYNVKVWESGYFDPTTSHDAPTDSIVGYVTPVLASSVPRTSGPPSSPSDAAKIAAQDHGR